jgi:hypothetical protein
MRELAVSGHERGDELLDVADAFDDAAADPNTPARELVRTWARCWKLWEECTGEKPFEGVTERAAKLAATFVLKRTNGGRR